MNASSLWIATIAAVACMYLATCIENWALKHPFSSAAEVVGLLAVCAKFLSACVIALCGMYAIAAGVSGVSLCA